MRIYLDTSVFNRPYDDQSQARVWLETLALGLILQMVEEKSVVLVVSSALRYENRRNPFPQRQAWVNRCCALAASTQLATEPVRDRAQYLAAAGVDPLDALHVACAEVAGCACLVTCDDRLVARMGAVPDTNLKVLNPLDFLLLMSGDGNDDHDCAQPSSV
ncbi:MAG: PIN domain-containing protein [Armatimonadetes bacterium CG_4_10_14_3_um_filter_66_18]|nr:PIN domain-containing protein [Armatimonadota bacterium]OIO99755.1 MAG: hypothetical protein AUJ96_19220 [Armatimonadetes bacterium CG2_30_66_41]PIU94681.1 MAG: PIN domain-containing protein [Armatimonadetes bacterium CG06_land_8_20_14_3_00_66_21]PIX43169.1 MAG: PIN domain-containing protein [Armatimonadetes bacterium CG_4_8_14_3_um_filter_66_20]PIY35991.1 MAG: PIN domain-containing protein [Armatimonadetes bacterium CG_4_10_14_3_um_filter_66_18]